MSRVSLHVAPAVALVAAAAMVFAPPAGASRAATAKQRRALTNAVHASHVAGINRVPRSHYRIRGQRVSTVSQNWATARLDAAAGFRDSFQNAVVVAVRPAGTAQWVVVDLGSSDVGCGIAPNKVLSDLFKTRQPCPPGQGIG
jgi:hypothetical protein